MKWGLKSVMANAMDTITLSQMTLNQMPLSRTAYNLCEYVMVIKIHYGQPCGYCNFQPNDTQSNALKQNNNVNFKGKLDCSKCL
jgi:hypothetical protein